MRGSSKKRGTHGLRKRCPICKKLRKFQGMGEQGRYCHLDKAWTKIGDPISAVNRWVCNFCVKGGRVLAGTEGNATQSVVGPTVANR